MRCLIRWLGRIALALVGLIAGCWGGTMRFLYGPEPMYGSVPVPPLPHDPTVSIEDFSYTPAGPVAQGTLLEFTVTTNKPTNAGYVQILIGDEPLGYIYPRDDGQVPDDTAADGIWVGGWQVPLYIAPGTLPVKYSLKWADQFPGTEFEGDPLIVVEQENDVE